MPARPDRMVRAAVAQSALAAVQARAPGEAQVVALEAGVDLAEVEFLVLPSPGGARFLDVLPGLDRLAVVQVLSAGTDWIEGSLPPQAMLCSARGARDANVAEWVLGALLGASSGLLECARERRWSDRHLADLGGSTVLVLGMGSIGRRVQSQLRALGTEVIGVGSQAHDDVHGVQELAALLPRADAVVVLTPLTDSTRGLVGEQELAAMSDGAVLINVARGPVVDAAALLRELVSGRLRAVLDVTDPEPLPDGHPLWDAPGVLAITPHIAGDSPLGNARAAELAGEQLARWCAGEELHNIVRRGSPGRRLSYDPPVPDRLYFTDSDEANALIASDPMALLVGFALDQQVSVQKAFSGPLALRERLGAIDPATLASADLEPVFRARPAIHRFPGAMAKRVRDLAIHVRDEYDGEAARIWTDAPDGRALRANLAALPGFGEMKVKALGSVLAKRFGVAAAQDLVPGHPTLGDVDSPQALADYQAAKRVHKAEWSKARAGS